MQKKFAKTTKKQALKLKCAKCGTLVKLDELVGLMKCTGCDETCEVGILMRKLEPKHTPVYIILGRRPVEERSQLSQEDIADLRSLLDAVEPDEEG